MSPTDEKLESIVNHLMMMNVHLATISTALRWIAEEKFKESAQLTAKEFQENQ